MTSSIPKSTPNQVMDLSYKIVFLIVSTYAFINFILMLFSNEGGFKTGMVPSLFWIWLAWGMYKLNYEGARAAIIVLMFFKVIFILIIPNIISIIQLAAYYVLYDFLNTRYVDESQTKSESVLTATKNKEKKVASNKAGKRLPNGDVYFGKFVAGKPSGKGRYEYKNGNVYTGPFKAGKMTGKGMLEFKNGQIYKGDFIDGKRTGKGVLTWPYGATYKGDFVNGRRTGKGTFIWCDGTVYEGNFINGKKCE